MEFLSGMDTLVSAISNVGLTFLFIIISILVINWVGEEL